MKKLARFFILSGLVITCSLVACSAKKAAKKNGANMETAAEETKPAKKTLLGCTEDLYTKAVDASILSLGNNYRIKKVIEKLEKGETVRICVLGGSVTEGAGIKDHAGNELWQQGYAFQFRDDLKKKYPKANIIFDGAGLSGTPSLLGMLRYDNHVVKELGGEPDLLVIEFAVNDGGEKEYVAATESLVRKVYDSSETSAVILLYADARSYTNSQESKKPVGTYYKVPQISIQDAVENKTFGIIDDLYFDDYVHPKKPGHTFMADCLMKLIEKESAAAEDSPVSVPAEYMNPLMNFQDFHVVLADTNDENVKVTKGGFKTTDASTQSMKKGGTAFPVNWHHSSNGGTEPLKFELTCRNFVIAYKVQGSWLQEKFGTAEVYVDGNKVAEYNGGDKGGWCNCVQYVIINEKTAAKHTVEIKMAEGSQKQGFTVLAVGYSK